MSRARSRALSNRRPDPPARTGPVAGSRTVLCLEDIPYAASAVVGQLEQHEGIHVVYCDPPATSEVCTCVTGARCALHDAVTVVLDVRSGTDSQLSRGEELGVVFAEQADVPIIAASVDRPSRQAVPWASATCTLDDAAEFCLNLMNSPVPLRDLRIDHLVRKTLSRTGDDVGDLTVNVTDWASEPVVSVCGERLPSSESCSAIVTGLRTLLDGECAVVYTGRSSVSASDT